VFEIGNSLREARVRRGIDFAQAETATKIRGKYLRALEDEQFALLPAQTYVKGFLRTYAEYLGLDGQLYVDEFNSRFVSGTDEHEPRARRSAARAPQQRRHRRLETNVVLVALAAIAVLTVIVISAWKASGGGGKSPKAGAGTTTSSQTSSTHVVPPMLEVSAIRGSSHMIVHRGSARGPVLFDGTITKGDEPVAIRGSRLWVSIDTPENLAVEIRGHPYTIPGSKPQVGIISGTGWHSLSG
jgi:cytoskeletal protein RodZ